MNLQNFEDSQMKIKYSLEKSPGETCVALGYFDGVHLGHQAVIKKAVEKSLLTHTIPTVFTFSQNPKSIIKNVTIKNISTPAQKEKLLCDIGIKLLYCVNFPKIMNLSPTEFVEKILVEILQARHVFCGFNFRFGKNATANATDLIEICKKYDIETFVIKPVKIQGTVVSSSQIRECILNGETEKADILLGKK